MSRIFIICGPSGTGKDTLLDLVLNDFSDFIAVPSYTTRPKRSQETTKRPYIFVSDSEFDYLVKSSQMVEWVIEHGYKYGVCLEPLDQALKANKNVIIAIEPRGAEAFKKLYGDKTTTIFIQPPSIDSLKTRIINDPKRSNLTPQELEKRLERAKEELNYSSKTDYQIVNEDGKMGQTYQAIKKIIVNQAQI